MKKVQILLGAFALLASAAFIICIMTDGMLYHVSGYDVDSLGRVYIGRKTGIEVFQNGEQVNRIRDVHSDGYEFILRENSVLVYAKGNVYTLDYDGNTLSQVPIEQSQYTWRDFSYEAQSIKKMGEDVYQSYRKLGGFCVERTRNGQKEIVFQYDFPILRVLCGIAVGCIIASFLVFCLRLLHGDLKRFHR